VDDVLVLLRVAVLVGDIPAERLKEGRNELGAAGLLVVRRGLVPVAVAGVALDEIGD
jgi:hypothetical protein